MSVKKVYIVGAGVGEQSYLTSYAKNIIESSDLVIATKRLFSSLSNLNKNTVCNEISEFINIIKTSDASVISVLASGDIGFYSIAKTLTEQLSGIEIEQVSGISSLQYLTAKLAIPYDDIKVISVHGRNKNPVPFICYNKKVFILTGGEHKAHDIINGLIDARLGDVWVTIGENLSDKNERIITDKAVSFSGKSFDNLSVMLVHNPNFIDCHQRIADNEFIRGKSPMTKEAVRTLSISYLNIKPHETIVDIGAGTGSCSVEMARRAHEGLVFAIEKETQANELIIQNVVKFKAFNIKVIKDNAPDNMEKLPFINKAFIGGSSGNLNEIIKSLVNNNPNVRIVVNAVTIETLTEAMDAFKQYGLTADISCINVSTAESVGRYNMMKASNPIYIIVGEASK